MNSPLWVRPLIAFIAPKLMAGRMIEHTGNFRLKNGHGSGMIRLVWKSSPPKGGELRSGNTRLSIGQRRRVSGLVLPGLEVHGLGRADTEQDEQNLRVGDLLGQCRVETGAALLDHGEMERRRVGNGLDVVLGSEVGIGPGNCRKMPCEQTWDRLRKHESRVKIRAIGAATIPRPPTGIDFELHEIGEAFFCFHGPRRLTAWQSAKRLQIDGRRALRNQPGVDESPGA